MSTVSDLDATTPPDVLVPLTLVPVEVFGGDCECHLAREATDHSPGCPGWSYGLCDAVTGYSDCNRAAGHIYRVDDTAARHRQPGETATISVSRDQLPFFEHRWGEDEETSNTAVKPHPIIDIIGGRQTEPGDTELDDAIEQIVGDYIPDSLLRIQLKQRILREILRRTALDAFARPLDEQGR